MFVTLTFTVKLEPTDTTRNAPVSIVFDTMRYPRPTVGEELTTVDDDDGVEGAESSLTMLSESEVDSTSESAASMEESSTSSS